MTDNDKPTVAPPPPPPTVPPPADYSALVDSPIVGKVRNAGLGALVQNLLVEAVEEDFKPKTLPSRR